MFKRKYRFQKILHCITSWDLGVFVQNEKQISFDSDGIYTDFRIALIYFLIHSWFRCSTFLQMDPKGPWTSLLGISDRDTEKRPPFSSQVAPPFDNECSLTNFVRKLLISKGVIIFDMGLLEVSLVRGGVESDHF